MPQYVRSYLHPICKGSDSVAVHMMMYYNRVAVHCKIPDQLPDFGGLQLADLKNPTMRSMVFYWRYMYNNILNDYVYNQLLKVPKPSADGWEETSFSWSIYLFCSSVSRSYIFLTLADWDLSLTKTSGLVMWDEIAWSSKACRVPNFSWHSGHSFSLVFSGSTWSFRSVSLVTSLAVMWHI